MSGSELADKNVNVIRAAKGQLEAEIQGLVGDFAYKHGVKISHVYIRNEDNDEDGTSEPVDCQITLEI